MFCLSEFCGRHERVAFEVTAIGGYRCLAQRGPLLPAPPSVGNCAAASFEGGVKQCHSQNGPVRLADARRG